MFQTPYGKSLLSFNLRNKRINHFTIFAYCLFFSFFFFLFNFFFFFLCHVTFSHDVLVGNFAMPMVFSPIFFLDHPFGFST